MTPQEAEQIMNPFYPDDPNLAMRAMDTALGGTIPEWILESVVGSYFTFLHIREGFIHMDRQTYSHDPFGLDTTPYTLDDTEIERN